MSGVSPVECRRRPMVIWLPVSVRCCSGEYAGRFRPAASGPERCIIAMKYSRSGPIVADQVVGCWGRCGKPWPGGAWVAPGCG